MNIMNILQLIGSNPNPMSIISAMTHNNPHMKGVFEQATKMSKGKSPVEQRQIVENLCKERGVDFNQMLIQLKNAGLKM